MDSLLARLWLRIAILSFGLSVGTAYQVITWGSSNEGGASIGSAPIPTYADVTKLVASEGAFASLTAHGGLYVWGSSEYGGQPPAYIRSLRFTNVLPFPRGFAATQDDGSYFLWYGVSSRSNSFVTKSFQIEASNDVKRIVSNKGSKPAFAVLLTNGSLLTFGERLYGGDVDYPFTGKSVYLRSKKLTQITAILGAFAGLTDTGEIIVWGSGAYDNLQSLDVLENQQFLFISIESNTESFAAIRNDSKILGWGWTTSPRDPRISPSSPPLPATAATVRKLFHTEYAFAALMSDGSVITWGRIFYGADSSSVSSQLNANVSDIFTTSRAFAALRHDNTVVTWGHTESGGDSSSVQHLLRNITTIASTSQSFCALSDSGMAVAWGSAHTGGNLSSISAALKLSRVQAIYSSPKGRAFAARLIASNRVVTWGDSQFGGNSSSVKQRLTWVGDVVPTLYAFAALDSTTKAPTTTNAPATDRPTGAPLSLAPSCGPSSSQPTSSPSTHVPTATPLTSMPTFSPTTSSPTQDYLHGLEVSSNLKEVSSHDDVARVTGPFILHPHFDAVVQRDVHRNHTVLKSSLLTSIAKGYIGVKIWQYSPSGQQVLLVSKHFEWTGEPCTFRAMPCPLLPLTSRLGANSRRAAMVEYRGPLSESSSNFEAIQDGGEGMGPYVITWVDPTGVVRAMRPTFNDSLLTLTKSSIEEGTSHSMNGVWRLFRTYIQAVIALFAVAMLLLMFSCVKIYQRNIRNKMQYALDVTGYRISLESDGYSMPTPSKDGKKKINETQLEVLHQDRLRWYHWLYIALVFGFQGALALLFTMSFMGMLFLAVNKEHFDILKQYPEFAVKRDSQLSGVVDAIEAAYRNETSRIDSTYFAKQHGCLAADAAIWSAYENNKTAVKAFHNLQFQTPPKGASKFDEISSEKACNLKGGAIYEKDSIAYNYKDPTSHEIVTWHLDPKSDEEKIMANLSEWCGNADWCRGYSFDRSNQHYYLFQKLPSPHIPTNEGANGTCFVILNDAWPSFDEVTGNLSKARKKYLGEYQQEVNRDVRDLNRMIDATNNSMNVIKIRVSRGPLEANSSEIDSYNAMTHTAATKRINGAWTTTFQSEAILTVPNLPTHVPEPLLKQVLSQETNVSATRIPSRSNQSLKLNDQMGLETVNVSSMVLPRLQDYIEYPQWRFSGAVLLKMLLALILLFDISWVIIRWFRILISTAQYVIGVRIKLKDSNVGKPDQFLFDLICKKLLCCGCLHSIHKCCLRIDEFVWELFYKMWKVFMAASIAFVLYILYYVTRQVVTVKTVGAFGVFQGMTLQQEIQRTIRNDEITAKANSKNAHGHATFTIGLHRSAARIRNDQYEFNLNEKARVDNWNSKYCATASEYALGIHELQLTKLQNLSTTVTSGRGSASLPLSAFAIESGTFGIDAYDIHSVAITWETDSVSSAPSSVNLAYRIGLAMGPLETNSNGSIIIITNHNIKYSPTITVLQQQQQRNKQRHVQRFKGVKATFMIIEVLSTANTQRGSYSIGDISVSGRGDAQSFRCPKVSWKQLDFNPNLYLGDCQRLDPIHGHMMRIWNRYEWTTDLKEAHAPFIDAVRSIVLSPFIILMFGVVTYVGVQVTIALLEYVLILAGMVRKHTYVEVPAVLVQTTVVEAVAEEKTEKDSGILKKSPRSDKSEDNDSIRREATFSRNQSSAWRSSRRLSFGSNKSKDIAMLGGLHSRRVSESFAISSVRPHLDRSTSQRSSGEATYRSDKSRDIAMMELNSGMNQSLRTSSPNRSMLGRASSPNRSVLASGRCKRIDLHMSGQDQSV